MDKYPGSNYKVIKILGEEETKTQLEESQCEGLKENRVIQSKLNILKKSELENKPESVTCFSTKLLFQA